MEQTIRSEFQVTGVEKELYEEIYLDHVLNGLTIMKISVKYSIRRHDLLEIFTDIKTNLANKNILCGKIYEDYIGGLSIANLAEKYQISNATIIMAFKKNGFKLKAKRPQRPRHFPPELWSKLLKKAYKP